MTGVPDGTYIGTSTTHTRAGAGGGAECPLVTHTPVRLAHQGAAHTLRAGWVGGGAVRGAEGGAAAHLPRLEPAAQLERRIDRNFSQDSPKLHWPLETSPPQNKVWEAVERINSSAPGALSRCRGKAEGRGC